jgi:hypothetical protein
MCKQNPLKHFRTIEGAERRKAMRAHLAENNGIVWSKSPHELTHTERSALDAMARAVAWRKSISSPLSLCAAFYVYLSREVEKTAHAAAQVKPSAQVAEKRRGPGLAYGRGFAA